MIDIDANTTIATLIKKYPTCKTIMINLGFEQLKNPIMLKTVGRTMTIKKGASMRNIDFNIVKKAFAEAGYNLRSETHE